MTEYRFRTRGGN